MCRSADDDGIARRVDSCERRAKRVDERGDRLAHTHRSAERAEGRKRGGGAQAECVGIGKERAVEFRAVRERVVRVEEKRLAGERDATERVEAKWRRVRLTPQRKRHHEEEREHVADHFQRRLVRGERVEADIEREWRVERARGGVACRQRARIDRSVVGRRRRLRCAASSARCGCRAAVAAAVGNSSASCRRRGAAGDCRRRCFVRLARVERRQAARAHVFKRRECQRGRRRDKRRCVACVDDHRRERELRESARQRALELGDGVARQPSRTAACPTPRARRRRRAARAAAARRESSRSAPRAAQSRRLRCRRASARAQSACRAAFSCRPARTSAARQSSRTAAHSRASTTE